MLRIITVRDVSWRWSQNVGKSSVFCLFLSTLDSHAFLMVALNYQAIAGTYGRGETWQVMENCGQIGTRLCCKMLWRHCTSNCYTALVNFWVPLMTISMKSRDYHSTITFSRLVRRFPHTFRC